MVNIPLFSRFIHPRWCRIFFMNSSLGAILVSGQANPSGLTNHAFDRWV